MEHSRLIKDFLSSSVRSAAYDCIDGPAQIGRMASIDWSEISSSILSK